MRASLCVRAEEQLQGSNVRVCVDANASVSVSGCDELTAGWHIEGQCTVLLPLEDEQIKGQQ